MLEIQAYHLIFSTHKTEKLNQIFLIPPYIKFCPFHTPGAEFFFANHYTLQLTYCKITL